MLLELKYEYKVVYLQIVLVLFVKLDLPFLDLTIYYKLCSDLLLVIIQLMVYGKILFNNIKEYTPKWYPTVPYSQTVKPVFGRKPQIAWNFNTSSAGKAFWRNLAFVFQRHSCLWQILVLGLTFVTYHICRDPLLMLYQANNQNRTYKAAITKEKAHKKKLKELEQKEQSSQ